MPTDWRPVRITFECARDIEPAGADDLLMQINRLVRERYPNSVVNVSVELGEPTDFLGRAGTS